MMKKISLVAITFFLFSCEEDENGAYSSDSVGNEIVDSSPIPEEDNNENVVVNQQHNFSGVEVSLSSYALFGAFTHNEQAFKSYLYLDRHQLANGSTFFTYSSPNSFITYETESFDSDLFDFQIDNSIDASIDCNELSGTNLIAEERAMNGVTCSFNHTLFFQAHLIMSDELPQPGVVSFTSEHHEVATLMLTANLFDSEFSNDDVSLIFYKITYGDDLERNFYIRNTKATEEKPLVSKLQFNKRIDIDGDGAVDRKVRLAGCFNTLYPDQGIDAFYDVLPAVECRFDVYKKDNGVWKELLQSKTVALQVSEE